MAQLQIDELNALVKDSVSVIPIKRYFQEMELTEDEKNRRIVLAERIANIILLVFLMMRADEKLNKTPDSEYYKDFMGSWIKYLLLEMGIEASNDLLNVIDEIVDDTITNTLKDKQQMTDTERSVTIAEDMSNIVENERDFIIAVNSGKKYKTWITMQDNRVRHTHRSLDSKTIPIQSLFQVGNTKMRFPLDTKYGYDAKEIIKCRCSCEYS